MVKLNVFMATIHFVHKFAAGRPVERNALMLDPRLLRAFVTICDAGGFTRAAELLNMTQSTISQQLGRLEEAVGRSLIDRSARPIRPTTAGERLLGHARRILALQTEAETLLRDPVGSAAIRIGVPEDIAGAEMARVFKAFSATHRQFRLDVTAGLSRDLMQRYRSGEFDIVVVKERAAEADSRASFPEPLGWFESAEAPPVHADPVPLVAFPPGGLYREAMFAAIERENRRWYVAFSGSSLKSVEVAVATGLGLSLLPLHAVGLAGLRPSPAFAPEPSMTLSLYAWENAGAIADLAAEMIGLLAQRARGRSGS